MSNDAEIMQPLSECASVQAGHPFRGSVPAHPGGGVIAVQMRDLTPDGSVAWDGAVRTSLPAGRAKPQWLQRGDILFVARGARNHAVCLQEVPAAAVCSQHFFLLRVVRAELLPEFLAWQINRAPAQRYLANNAEGTDQRSIRRAVLEALPVAVPTPARQQCVVDLAAAAVREKQTFDRLVRNRQRQLDALAFDLLSRDTAHR